VSGARLRRRIVAFAALAGTTLGIGLLTAPSAYAVDKVATGVWWRDETGATTVPPPPQVPAGGLWVSSDPSGPSAISALHFTLADSEGFPALTLRVANLTAPPPSPAAPDSVPPIQLCASTHAWTPPASSPGSWADRPTYDCALGSVSGQFAPDNSTVRFDLTVLPTAQSYDLVLVPGTPSPGAVAPPPAPAPAPLPVPAPAPAGSPTFDLSFQPVKAADLSTLPTASGSTPQPDVISSPELGVGPAALAWLDPPVAPAPAVPAPLAATRPPAVILPTASHAVATLAGTSRTNRVIAGLVFCALAAWAWRLMSADGGADLVGGRLAMTLYDSVPLGPDVSKRRRFTSERRSGTPPTLR
jgi:hypothetical protein